MWAYNNDEITQGFESWSLGLKTAKMLQWDRCQNGNELNDEETLNTTII